MRFLFYPVASFFHKVDGSAHYFQVLIMYWSFLHPVSVSVISNSIIVFLAWCSPIILPFFPRQCTNSDNEIQLIHEWVLMGKWFNKPIWCSEKLHRSWVPGFYPEPVHNVFGFFSGFPNTCWKLDWPEMWMCVNSTTQWTCILLRINYSSLHLVFLEYSIYGYFYH